MKTIIIFGANGFLGRYLTDWLVKKGWKVIGIARRETGMHPDAKFVKWNGLSAGEWEGRLEGSQLVVNLAGRSVNCRYGAKNREAILKSRVDTTRLIGEAIHKCDSPPSVWVNSSTATIYRHAEDFAQTEKRGELGTGFSVEVAKAWEDAFMNIEIPGSVRRIALRSSLVLANETGTVYDYLFKLALFGVGGRMGSGRQRVSWIHQEDFCRVVEFLEKKENASGIYNLVAPQVVTNAECMSEFRRIAGRSFGIPACRWMLEFGAAMLRTETELILKSRWVSPERLLEEGFLFKWPELNMALDDLKE